MGISFKIELQKINTNFNGENGRCWVHARAATAPDGMALITTQQLRLSGADIFYGINNLISKDSGKTWTEPITQKNLDRRKTGDIEMFMCDATPAYHKASGKFFMPGIIGMYKDDEFLPHPRKTFIGWTVFDRKSEQWKEFQILSMPETPEEKYFATAAGCTQWIELENGNILLPFYFRSRAAATAAARIADVAVARCSFDGESLKVIEIGESIHIDDKRGLTEPSICRIGNCFYMTIRAEERAYAAVSSDGLNFKEMKAWCFDDSTELGSYNTQQHWITHNDELYLAYTRRNADNDHVFRHRAPLFISQIDREKMHAIRSTERIAVPERGATLGNFGCNHVNENESWVVAAEWMQTTMPNPHDWRKCMSYGSDNSIFISKFRW